nr:uncharacterized protein LOC128692850 [Cherax quadricarinatus]
MENKLLVKTGGPLRWFRRDLVMMVILSLVPTTSATSSYSVVSTQNDPRHLPISNVMSVDENSLLDLKQDWDQSQNFQEDDYLLQEDKYPSRDSQEGDSLVQGDEYPSQDPRESEYFPQDEEDPSQVLQKGNYVMKNDEHSQDSQEEKALSQGPQDEDFFRQDDEDFHLAAIIWPEEEYPTSDFEEALRATFTSKDDNEAPFEKLVGFQPSSDLEDILLDLITSGDADEASSESLEGDLEATAAPADTTNTQQLLKEDTILQSIRSKVLYYLEREGQHLGREYNNMNLPSVEVALLSLAFLTFVVFIVDLVQDLLTGSSSSGRKRAADDADDSLADLIVLTLSSLDTVSYGREHPDCGRKLLCHLNRSGWHSGVLGTASNYFVSLVLTVFSPASDFQRYVDAADYGRQNDECADRYSSCPSVLGDLLPSTP